eukprot:g60884.t1
MLCGVLNHHSETDQAASQEKFLVVDKWTPSKRGLDHHHMAVMLHGHGGLIKPIPASLDHGREDVEEEEEEEEEEEQEEEEEESNKKTEDAGQQKATEPSQDILLQKMCEIQADDVDCDLVVLPSITFDQLLLKKFKAQTIMKRGTCGFSGTWLTLIRALPSSAVSQFLKNIVRYQLGLMNVPVEDSRKRLLMVSCHNTSSVPLSYKLAKQPRVLNRVRNFLRPGRGVLQAFVFTAAEKAIAESLHIPFIGCDPQYAFYGTKQGSRQMFRLAGIPHCAGTYHDIKSVGDVAKAILALSKEADMVVVKTNDGVSGLGNATYLLPHSLLDSLPDQRARQEHVASELLAERLHKAQGISTSFFFAKIAQLGGIVEKMEQHPDIKSPSAQLLISPSGRVSLVSTHEQLLEGLSFKGCIFPAEKAYRKALQKYALKLGEAMAKIGVRDRFAVDFIAWQEKDTGEWKLAAIEINLRHGGTTMPSMTCMQLCNADFDQETGHYVSGMDGKHKSYVATDNLKHSSLVGLTPRDFIEIVDEHKELQWDKTTQTGCVFHLIDCLAEHGKVGLTAIGNSRPEAHDLFKRCQDKLLQVTAHDHDQDLHLSFTNSY